MLITCIILYQKENWQTCWTCEAFPLLQYQPQIEIPLGSPFFAWCFVQGGVTSVIHSFLFQFFTDTRVGISPAGSAVIGPQIAQYILLRTATKNQFYHFCSFLVWWNAFTEHFERSLPFYKGKAVSGSQSTIGAKNKKNPQAQPQLTNRFELYRVFQLRHGCMRQSLSDFWREIYDTTWPDPGTTLFVSSASFFTPWY